MGEIAVARMDNAQLMSRIEGVIGVNPANCAGRGLILIAPTGWGKSIVFSGSCRPTWWDLHHDHAVDAPRLGSGQLSALDSR